MRSFHTLTGLVAGDWNHRGRQDRRYSKDIPSRYGQPFSRRVKREGVADSFGPGAIRLYSPPVAEAMTGENDYLRAQIRSRPPPGGVGDPWSRRERWTVNMCGPRTNLPRRRRGCSRRSLTPSSTGRPLTKLGEKEAVIVQWAVIRIGKHKVGSDTFAAP